MTNSTTTPVKMPGRERCSRSCEQSVWEYYRKENDEGRWMPRCCICESFFCVHLIDELVKAKSATDLTDPTWSMVPFRNIFPLFRTDSMKPGNFRSDLMRSILSASATSVVACSSLDLPAEVAGVLAQRGAETLEQACALLAEEILSVSGTNRHTVAQIRYAIGAKIHDGLRGKSTGGWFIDWGEHGL